MNSVTLNALNDLGRLFHFCLSGRVFLFNDANYHFHVCLFQIYIVYNKRTGKPRGYAFIEYEHERDMHCEYQRALNQNLLLDDHMLMKTDLCDMHGGSSVEPLSFSLCGYFCNDTGVAAVSNT